MYTRIKQCKLVFLIQFEYLYNGTEVKTLSPPLFAARSRGGGCGERRVPREAAGQTVSRPDRDAASNLLPKHFK